MPVALSTILYIGDVPVGYEISRKGNYILFSPTRFSEVGCCPPQFSALKQADGYHFPETIADDVRAQALQALQQLHAGKLLE